MATSLALFVGLGLTWLEVIAWTAKLDAKT